MKIGDPGCKMRLGEKNKLSKRHLYNKTPGPRVYISSSGWKDIVKLKVVAFHFKMDSQSNM